ncbi:MAG TPA: cation:proton antiporter, partial [Candidatus Hydrogenedentes bacterium]|nr:cation:proton antiporter [Candidatus Hydrogenedentota bacterium]
LGVLKTLVIGLVMGGVAAAVLVVLLERYWIPEHLQTPGTLALVVAAFAASNGLQHESGLLTVTVMGILLANQRRVEVRHVIEFKENLRVVLLSALFIVLAARLDPGHLAHIDGGAWLFLAVVILLVRPLSVALCTLGSRLNWRERVFIAWMAPRGIVAAAIASVFALRLEAANFPNAEQLVAVTFLVVAATVLLYGLTSGPLARALGVSRPHPQGVLLVGAHPLARQMALALHREGVTTALVDSNWANVAAARMDGLRACIGDANSEYVLEDLDTEDLGRMIALTANSTVNAVAALVFADVFGRREVYQLSPDAPEPASRGDRLPGHLRGRTLFGADCTFGALTRRLEAGALIKTTKLTKEFPYGVFRAQYGDAAVPLFAVLDNGQVHIFTSDDAFTPQPGSRVISLAPPLPY